MKKTLSLLSIMTMFVFSTAFSQSVVGLWKTIDDETGKPKSIVKLEIRDGKVYGNIIKLFRAPDEEQDPDCDECPGKLKGKKIIGMQIVNGLEKDDNEWEADDGIIDPKSGKIYDCKIWVDKDEPNKLNVRGYISFFYRTQTWIREK